MASPDAALVPKTMLDSANDVGAPLGQHDITSQFQFATEELKVLALWKELDAFQETIRQSTKENRKAFSFYDGPVSMRAKMSRNPKIWPGSDSHKIRSSSILTAVRDWSASLCASRSIIHAGWQDTHSSSVVPKN
jgi:hypothetical protein